MMRCVRLPVACALGVLCLLAACDTAPGPEALDRRPPSLNNFTFSPQRVVFDQLPAEQIVGDSVRVPITMHVAASGSSSPVEEVAFVVQSPVSLAPPLATGVLDAAGGNAYTGTTTITIPANEVTTYTVLVYAVDQAQRLSGEARGTLTYLRTFDPGSPPVIENLEVPETVTRPAPGEPDVVFQFVATVSDPDGPGNVARVEVDIEGIGVLRLCDDGGEGECNAGFPNSGDAVTDDGRYTLTLQIASTNQPDTLTLRFKAIDRAGLESEVVERTFVIL